MTLGKLAAHHAFFETSKTTLQSLAKEEDVAVPKGSSLPELILLLATHYLGELSLEEQMKILRLRVKFDMFDLDILELDEVDSVLSQSEKNRSKRTWRPKKRRWRRLYRFSKHFRRNSGSLEHLAVRQGPEALPVLVAITLKGLIWEILFR